MTTEVTLAELQEYAGQLARKRRLSVDLVLLAAAALPVTTVPRTVYASSLAEARKRIARRDPDDVELLALAIQLKLPVWSNDSDFEERRFWETGPAASIPIMPNTMVWIGRVSSECCSLRAETRLSLRDHFALSSKEKLNGPF